MRRSGEFLPITVDLCVELFKVLNNSLSCEMAGNVVRDYRKFVTVSNGVKNAMSDGGGDSGGYNSVEA
jgi:hypothetical protein